MFTGLIQTIGTLLKNDQAGNIWVKTDFDALELGESIAVNGVCLTVSAIEKTALVCFHLSPETQKVCNLTDCTEEDLLNLERALLPTTRLGGHFVCGHVDQVLTVAMKEKHENCLKMRFSGVHPSNQVYLLPKGSITVNGVSLTINEAKGDSFEVMLVPETQNRTMLAGLPLGDSCHVEFDMLVKAAVNAQNCWKEAKA